MYPCKSSGLKYAVPLAIGLTLVPGILDKADQISGKYFAPPVIEYVQNMQKDKKNIKVERDVNKDGKEDLVYLAEEKQLGFPFYKLIVKEGLGDGKFGKEHLIEKNCTGSAGRFRVRGRQQPGLHRNQVPQRIQAAGKA